jgi:hypothetical protein
VTIPDGPEWDATRELGEQLRAAGVQEKADMDGARRQRRRRRTAALGTTGLVILVAGGTTAVGTKVFEGDGGSVSVDQQGPPELKRVPADRRLAAAQAADPAESAPWGLRLYTGVGSKTCVVVGRVVRGRLGVLQSARFTELPANAPGACGDLTRSGDHVFATWRTYGAASGSRTILYGAADRTIQALSFGRDGNFASIPIARDGTFIVVLSGTDTLRGRELRVRSGNGVVVKPMAPTAH